jgi:hypothetical protein
LIPDDIDLEQRKTDGVVFCGRADGGTVAVLAPACGLVLGRMETTGCLLARMVLLCVHCGYGFMGGAWFMAICDLDSGDSWALIEQLALSAGRGTWNMGALKADVRAHAANLFTHKTCVAIGSKTVKRKRFSPMLALVTV